MPTESELLRQIATTQGYRFETDWRGVERMYGPDGNLILTAGSFIPEAPVPDNLPPDVTIRPDGSYSRPVVERDKDGRDVVLQALVCEDCWSAIPSYVDFPNGLVSPESDGDANGNFAKTRIISIEGKMGMAHLAKVVCLPCYLAAFSRRYPDGALPDLRTDVRETRVPIPTPPPEVYVAEPKGVSL